MYRTCEPAPDHEIVWYESHMELPSFNDRDGHEKLEPLTRPSEPGPSMAAWLSRMSRNRDRSALRVLDVGCGRGGTVAWLLDEGFDAFGIDVRADYVENGAALLGPNRLALLDGERYPYPDDYFDIVLSDQVLEHVADLTQLAHEVARTTRVGGVGLHVFPAKWIFEEPHLHAPMVHWLPKGSIRHGAIKFALKTGCAAPYFADYPLSERARIYSKYSDEETFYRRPAEIRRVLQATGLVVDLREASRDRVRYKLGNRPVPDHLIRIAAWAYRNTRVMYLTTVKADAQSRTR